MKQLSLRSTAAALAVAALVASLAPAAQAQVVDGNFGAGLAGWDSAGDAAVLAASATQPTRLWLTTASTAYADDIDSGLAAGARNVSGHAAVDVATGAAGALEGFAGVPVGAFDPAPGQGLVAYEGSAARQSFNAGAGATLSFRWDFGTLDPRADSAFVVIDGHVTTLAGSADARLGGTDGNAAHTGWASFRTTFADAGAHTIAFGVVDVGDYDATSTLAIAGVSVSAVPEAPRALLLLGGLGLVGALARRRPA